MTTSSVTVIIVNRKTHKLTETCLISLFQFYPDIPVLLIDNRSGAGPALEYVKYAAATYPNVKALYIVKGEPHHARGLNLGVERTTTPYFLTLDSDVTVLRGEWIEKMLQAFADDDKLFAIGHLCRNAGKDCVTPPKGRQPKFNFVHPFCAMWDRVKYNRLGVVFAYTGQPACYICINAEQKGYHLANVNGIHPHNKTSVPLYVRHVWGGTRTRLAVLADKARKKK